MSLFRRSCYLLAFILPVTQTAQTLSSPQLQGSSDILSNQVDLQGEGLSPTQFNLFPGPAEPDNNNLLDSSQNSALLFDGDNGVTNVLPPLGIPIPDIFPNGFPKFIDPDGILRWLNKPKKPDCDNGKSLFCCQLGPPRPLVDPKIPYETAERMAERQTRMRECVPWSEEEPACHFPENQACCDCRSIELKTAFGCYLPVWRDNPDYRDTAYPGPLRLPKPRQPPKRYRKSRARPKPGELNPNPPDVLEPGDLNPSVSPESSEPGLPGQKKRDWSSLDSGEMGSSTNLLYAAKPHPKTRPIQQDPDDPRCSDAYLEGVGLRSFQNLRGPDDPAKPPVRRPTKTPPEQELENPPMPLL